MAEETGSGVQKADGKPMESFLVTGSSDGIGLQTAKMLAMTAPDGAKRVIGLHGKDKDKLDRAY